MALPILLRATVQAGDPELAARLLVGIPAQRALDSRAVASGDALMLEGDGELEGAAAAWAAAAAGWHEFGAPYEEAQARLAQGRCQIALGRAPRQRPHSPRRAPFSHAWVPDQHWLRRKRSSVGWRPVTMTCV